MADWRIRKYVADSEDEEEVVSDSNNCREGEHDPAQNGFLDIDHLEELEHNIPELRDPSSPRLDNEEQINVVTQGNDSNDFPTARTLVECPDPRADFQIQEPVPLIETAHDAEDGFTDTDELLLGQTKTLPAEQRGKKGIRWIDRPSRTKRKVQDDSDTDELQQDNHGSASLTLPTSRCTNEGNRQVHNIHHISSDIFPTRNRTGSPKSTPSSPLTDLSRSPSVRASPHVASEAQLQSFPTSLSLAHPSTQQASFKKPASHIQENTIEQSTAFDTRGMRRVFRHRNANQLHPYTLEGERYRQTLQARGLKPIRIDQEDSQMKDTCSDSSQDQNYAAEENSHFINDGDVTQDRASSPPTGLWNLSSSPLVQDSFAFDQDEFPDVDSLLRRPVCGVAYQGFKRRKTVPTFSNNTSPQAVHAQANSPTVSTLSPASAVPLKRLPRHDITHLGSKKSTPARTSIVTNNGFRFPLGTAPNQLPTPLPSSESYRARETVLDDTSESAVESTDQSETCPASEGGTTVDVSSSDSEMNNEIQRVQRKIKGVLPASWLRLDLQLRTTKSESEKSKRQAISVSPVERHDQRGVARPLSGHYKDPFDRVPVRGQSAASLEVGSDQDTSSVSDHEETEAQEPNNDQNDIPVIDDDSLNFMEDNDFDRMLPPRSRATKTLKWTNWPTTTFIRAKHKTSGTRTGLLKQHGGTVTRQPKIWEHAVRDKDARTRAPKFRQPQLSILDAIYTAEKKSEPAFIRLATRTARSRADKGRHSPRRKFIRLATRNDTVEVEDTMERWRRGALLPQKSSASGGPHGAERLPLEARSANAQYKPSDTYPRSPKRVQKRLARQSRTRTSAKSVRNVQKTLEEVLQYQYQEQFQEVSSVDATSTRRPRNTCSVHKARITSNLRDLTPCVPAMLESIQEPSELLRDLREPKGNTSKNVAASKYQASSQNPMLQRYLQTPQSIFTDQPATESTEKTPTKTGNSLPTISIKKPRHRKRRLPQRINLSAPQYQQKPSPDPDPEIFDYEGPALQETVTEESSRIGLQPFGSEYEVDFGVEPLSSGIRFRPETFIGSGSFGKSLGLVLRRDLDARQPSTVVKVNEKFFEWGPWNDSVSAQIGTAFNRLSRTLEQSRLREVPNSFNDEMEEAISIIEVIVRYITDSLSFLDSIDRLSFTKRCTGLALSLLDELGAAIEVIWCGGYPSSIAGQTVANFHARISTRCLVLVNQLHQIASHNLVPNPLRVEVHSVLDASLRQMGKLLFDDQSDEIESFLKKCTNLAVASHGIHEGQCAIEGIVVLLHITRQTTLRAGSIWSVFNASNEAWQKNGNLTSLLLDRQWRRIFRVLPFFAFNSEGQVDPAKADIDGLDNWNSVSSLLKPVLDSYILNPTGQGTTFNSYCRTIFARCLHLIQIWNWKRCDSIIGTLFDFFAKNSMANLYKEECLGSPFFLEQLCGDPSLRYRREDRCFHILLKILGSGLRNMRSIYPEKKISGIVFRLMPNHNRSHPKDKAIRQEDLDALRNHHDLLCTLYWASPAGFRPRLGIIQHLVHLEDSHREVCHINIRSWSNLVRFQLSTDEPITTLEAFAEWYSDLVEQVLCQHKVARTEVENQVQRAESANGYMVARELQESTIARNQRQVEAILCDALVSLRKAIESAKYQGAATILLSKALSEVFALFDDKHPRIDMVIIEALQVILAYNEHLKISNSNIDSQGFDGSSVFDEDFGQELPKHDIHMDPTIYESLRRLVSNCFGADIVSEDNFLVKLVETWSSVAQVAVQNGTKTWESYLGSYGPDTWTSLADTEQTRKFSVYFLAKIIQEASGVYEECKGHIFKNWVRSLVERESLLKFQHQLTTAVLNLDRDNPLLVNLPFSVNGSINAYGISLAEFRDRRLSLISSMLVNMRESLDFSTYHNLFDRALKRQEYVEILKTLMTSMKNNYQELGHGSQVRGAYVEFVQKVVEFLQQYSAEICPVDQFFTDSAAFPLPVKDPTYVVGRLRNYGLRLQEGRTLKQLATFVQASSERACVDGQQQYLIEQLHTAMSKNFENGDQSKPTLRSFLIQAIFPAYLEVAMSTSCGWLLAMPILEALRRTMSCIIGDLDGANGRSVDSVETTFMTLCGSVQNCMTHVVNVPEEVVRPTFLRTSTALLSVIRAALPTFDYVVRLRRQPQPALQAMTALKDTIRYITLILSGETEMPCPEALDYPVVTDTRIQTIQAFTKSELEDTLRKNWSEHDHHFYVLRSNTHREVSAGIGTLEEEKAGFLEEVQHFLDVLAVLPAFCDIEDEVAPRRLVRTSMEELVF